MWSKVLSVALGVLASLAFLPMVVHIPGIWRVYAVFERSSYIPLAFAVLITWLTVTIWVVVRSTSKPYWLFIIGAPAVYLGAFYALFGVACMFGACL